MASELNARLLCALLLLCVHAATLGAEPADGPAGDTSGEEEEEEVMDLDLLSASRIWEPLIGATKRHQKEFEDEFQSAVDYNVLDDYKVSSPPARCPSSNLSMESCLRRLAKGLQTYTVLFKYVAREYPSSSILAAVRHYTGLLISQMKAKMRHPEQVRALTSSQEEQLLKGLNDPTTFNRKMAAHSILRELHNFLRNAKADISKREKHRAKMASRILRK